MTADRQAGEHLKSVKGDQTTGSVGQMPPPLVKVQEKAVDLLGKYLAGMLDGADDKLFDMADSAGESERDRYFDAMRELRSRRQGLESSFRHAISNNFRIAILGRDAALDGEVNMDDLALVEEEELEENVALDSMARRVRDGCEKQLRIFNHRLEHILEGREEFSERNNPLDPRQIVVCFSDELEKLELDIRTRLVVLKLFERMVLAEVGYIVTEANQCLIEAGILPDLEAPPIKPKRQPGEVRTEAAESTESPSSSASEHQVFSMLQELLTAVRVPGTGGAGGDQGIAVMQNGVPYLDGAPVEQDESVRPVSTRDLVSLLDRLQRLEERFEEKTDDDYGDVRSGLAEILQEEDSESIHAFDQADNDVINLVSMLFDFIMDDDNLAADIKALLGRLQIPLLKVAIAEKEFFSDDEHPARMLVNLMAQVGTGWSPDQGHEDEVYKRIEEAVFSIINDFESDTEVFQRLLEQFREFSERQSRQIDRVEERVRQVEEGRARSEEARQAAAEVISKRMNKRLLPKVVIQMLRDAWQQVLYLTHLREGPESEAWKRRVKLVDALIWSALPHRDEESRNKLRELSPRLLGGVKAGLDAVGYDAVETRTVIRELEAIHLRLLKGEETQRVDAADVVEAPQQEQGSEQPAGMVTAEGDPEPLDEDHPRVKEIRKMATGAWVEFRKGDGGLRCKLAANIRDGEKLIFINRRGIKLCEYSAPGFAALLENDLARIIEESAVFDKALETMIGDLRKAQGSA